MSLSMHGMAVDTFVPMLTSLDGCLDKSIAHAKAESLDLVGARLAPDMFTLAQQVQMACHYASDCVARLTGGPAAPMPDTETSLAGLKAQIGRTLEQLRTVRASAFEGAEKRDCSIPLADGMVIAMNGQQLLRAWSLPHFYFHIVTAYGLLRHNGVDIGKQDYQSQVGAFIRPQATRET